MFLAAARRSSVVRTSSGAVARSPIDVNGPSVSVSKRSSGRLRINAVPVSWSSERASNYVTRLAAEPNSIVAGREIVCLLTEWAGTMSTNEMASRLNARSLWTLRGEAWSAPAVARKVATLGLAVPARQHIDELLGAWSGKLTVHEMLRKLLSMKLRTVRGRAWSEEQVRRYLARRGLSFGRRRNSPTVTCRAGLRRGDGGLPFDEMPWPG